MMTTDRERSEALMLAIARTFVEMLREELSPEDWREMCARNDVELNSAVCHSHDFCDANMVMEAAFRRHHQELDEALWNDVWSHAAETLRGAE